MTSNSSGWEKLKKLLGFSGKKCENGAQKTNAGDCTCLKYFVGPTCHWTVCVNGGNNISATECVCLNHRFSGPHCQMTKCDNGGRDSGNGSCVCVNGWYSGQFCETYGNAWAIVFGLAGSVLIALILFFIIYCLGCRSRCRRRQDGIRSTERRNRRNGHQSAIPNGMVVDNNSGDSVSDELQTQIVLVDRRKPPDYRSETPPPSYDAAVSMDNVHHKRTFDQNDGAAGSLDNRRHTTDV